MSVVEDPSAYVNIHLLISSIAKPVMDEFLVDKSFAAEALVTDNAQVVGWHMVTYSSDGLPSGPSVTDPMLSPEQAVTSELSHSQFRISTTSSLPSTFKAPSVVEGDFLPEDHTSFYVDFGKIDDYSSLILTPASLFVTIDHVISLHDDYGFYEASFEDCRGPGAIRYTLRLIIPSNLGTPTTDNFDSDSNPFTLYGFTTLADLQLPLVASANVATESDDSGSDDSTSDWSDLFDYDDDLVDEAHDNHSEDYTFITCRCQTFVFGSSTESLQRNTAIHRILQAHGQFNTL